MQELCRNMIAERMGVSEEFDRDTVLPQRLKDYIDNRRKNLSLDYSQMSFIVSTLSPQPKP